MNFVLYVFLHAFPKEECNKNCSLHFPNNCECNEEKEMSCCSNIESKINQLSNTLDHKISKSACEFEYVDNDNYSYVVPKVNDSKIDFSLIAVINIGHSHILAKNKFLSYNNITYYSPPIYLTSLSLLI